MADIPTSENGKELTNDRIRPQNNSSSDDNENKKPLDENNDDINDNDPDDNDDLEKEANEIANDAVNDVGNVMVKTKNSLQSAVKVIKSIGKFIANLIKMGMVGWIIIAVVLVFFIIILLVFSFSDNNNGNETSYRSMYDTQDLGAEKKFNDRKKVREEMQSVQDALKNVMTDEEFEEITNQLLDLNTSVNDYSDNLISFYDTNAGYQILNQDGTLLLLLERLSYAYNYTDWEPEYDYNGDLENKYNTLKGEIEAEEAKPKESREWSSIKMRNKKQELDDLEDTIEELDYKVERYKELNTLIKEKVDKEFVNSSKKAKEHPDGTPVKDKALNYFKDKYGVDTSEVREELTYFHTIMYRTFKWNKSETNTKLDDAIKLIVDPKLDIKDATEENIGTSLSYVEAPFRAKFELMHHEITLNLINQSNILNSVFTQPEAISKLKKTLSSHMPIFEYVTYSDKIAGKTFYNYELYDEDRFDNEGNYIFESDFDKKIDKYVKDENINIDFSGVEAQAENEYLLQRYQTQLEQQHSSSNPDRLLIEELNELITELEIEIGENSSSDEMLTEYKEHYDNLMKKQVQLDKDDRPYDAHNHNIIVDDLKDPKYYIIFADMPVDGYTNQVSLTETLEKTLGVPDNAVATYGAWQDSTSGIAESSCKKTYETKIDIEATQSSLKPTKIRTLLNSADYYFEKTSVVRTEDEIKKLLENARKEVKWQKRKVTCQLKDPDGNDAGNPYELGYEYKKITTITFTNTEKVTSTVHPYETNEDMYLDTSTYLTDFYGQTELLSDDYKGYSPGILGGGGYIAPGSRNYVPGHISMTYYNQYDYPKEPYGDYTVANNGCGPTCMSMIISSMTTTKITPPEMCTWAYKNGYYAGSSGTYRRFINESAVFFGLNCKKISRFDRDGVVKALSAGHPVVEICGPGDFTTGGHFIVLTGIDEDGNVTVADPASRKKSQKTWDINVIMSNASKKADEWTFWEIY